MMKYENSDFAFLLPSAVLLLILRKRAQQARGVADIDPWLVDILRYNGAGPDYYSIANSDRQDGGIRSNANAVANLRPPPEFLFSAGRTAGCKKVVNEHCPMRNETIVANHDQLANEGV